ncbi:MAG: energy transducer TonB [Gammaproteobacteria bacterium]|nr:energy transducer TonB [Gammaproteobacteria bacterium]
METLTNSRPLWIALGVSLTLHVALLLLVKIDFAPIPRDPIVLNMRLVKPVEQPRVKEAVIDQSLTDHPVEEPVQSVTEVIEDDSNVIWEINDIFTSVLPGMTQESDEEEPLLNHTEESPDSSPLDQLSAQDIVQSIADMAAAKAEEEDKKRIRRLAGEGTSSIEETFYLRSWLRKVRRVGQLNYPSEAVEQKLYGKLSLYVSIAPDGSLVETRVLESSGHEVLDEAAVEIVKLAAPFAPFPPSIANDTDLLEIVREWEFRKNAYTTDPPKEE